MIREPTTGPRAWTRRTIRPVPTYLLAPSDYKLDACRNLLGEVRRRRLNVQAVLPSHAG